MNSLFTVAGLPVTVYGIGIACSLILFWLLSSPALRGRGVSGGKRLVFMVCTALLGWLFARVLYVLCSAADYIDLYDGNWSPALCFWDGGYAITGAILGAVLGAWLSGLLTGVRPSVMADGVGYALPLAIAAERVLEYICDTESSGDLGEGKFFEGNGWLENLLSNTGLVMKADGDFAYPVCLLEALVALLILLAVVIWVASRGWKKIPAGDVLAVSLLLWGASQVILEQLRDDGHLVFHFVHLQQVLALVAVLIVLIVYTVRHARNSKNGGLRIGIWIVCLICFGLAVLACFGIDRWENKLAAWLMLIVPMIVSTAAILTLRSAANYASGDE